MYKLISFSHFQFPKSLSFVPHVYIIRKKKTFMFCVTFPFISHPQLKCIFYACFFFVINQFLYISCLLYIHFPFLNPYKNSTGRFRILKRIINEVLLLLLLLISWSPIHHINKQKKRNQ